MAEEKAEVEPCTLCAFNDMMQLLIDVFLSLLSLFLFPNIHHFNVFC